MSGLGGERGTEGESAPTKAVGKSVADRSKRKGVEPRSARWETGAVGV